MQVAPQTTLFCFLVSSVLCTGVYCQSVAKSSEPLPRQPTLTQGQRDSKESSRKTERQIDMRSKLKMVQKIVEGIATEDFEMINAGGRELVALAESAAWKSHHDPYYRHYSANFEHAAKSLIAAAKSKSIEKATFAYVHVTISCTACHQSVRNTVRTAR